MKQMLYIAPVNIDFDKPDGVAKKVLNHFSVFSNYFDIKLVTYGLQGIQTITNKGVEVKKYGSKHRRFELYEYVTELIKSRNYNYVYIRYPKSEPHFIKLLKALKEYGVKIVVEIPTYPYNGERFHSTKSLAIALIDAIYRNKIKNYVNRIITYSNDCSIFGIKTIQTINGVIFDKVAMRSIPQKVEDKITLIAVATFYDCHGYDRIIEGLHNYYANGGKRKINFHIVGTGPAISGYKLQIDKYNLNDHVFLKGYRTGQELDQLYNDSNIAVNSIAIHRLKLKNESTLKTKEYAAKGLPMISSYFVDAFDESGNQKYVLRVPSDNSPININKIIDFYTALYSQESAKSLAAKIREASKNICDMENTLKPVIDFFQSDLE